MSRRRSSCCRSTGSTTAIPSIDNPAFAARCAERGILFTVVPTNSYYLRTLDPARWALDHPIRRMPGLGLRIHPNTDDPPLHRIDPAGCWRKMVEDFGFGPADLRGFMLNGIDGAFLRGGPQARPPGRFHRRIRPPAGGTPAGARPAGDWRIEAPRPARRAARC